MNFEYQLNSTDCEEAYLATLNGSSESEKRTFHKWVLLIGIFFLLMGMLSQENGFLVVGVVLVSPSILSIFCKLLVKKGVEEIYEMYDVKSDISLDRDREIPNIANSTNWGEPTTVISLDRDREIPNIANLTNWGEPTTVEVIGEGLVLNTPSWQGTFKWENFEFFTETRNLLVIYPVLSLYPVPESNFIIPKRSFSDEEQWSNFREVLRHNIGKRHYNYLNKTQTQFFNRKSKI
jgi:hypothetical protein